MFQEVRRVLRGAFLAVAIVTGTAMLSATPSHAIPGGDECAPITAGSPSGDVSCAYCEILDSGNCWFWCADTSHGFFECDDFS